MIYKLKSLECFQNNWVLISRRLFDIDEPGISSKDKSMLQAQVASGDFFVTLATSLDQISQSLSRSQHSDYILLEKAISDLLYLHQNYQIVKK